MSKHGMKLGGETVFSVDTPNDALEKIEKIIAQYFGEQWTQFLPKCPLCDEQLQDCEKHMMMPVGECTNPKCMSTIHTADYAGKIRDVLQEWNQSKEQWMEDMKKEVLKKHPKKVKAGHHGHAHRGHACGGHAGSVYGQAHQRSVQQGSRKQSASGETIFIW